MRISKWIKRAAIAAAACLAIAVLSGAAFERVSRERALKRFPVPCRLVDIGGRRIQVDCRGSGSPTVVLEAGLDVNGSLAWSDVHDSIAATTRACAYSRAGIMWSDPSVRPFDSDSAASDLHTALLNAGERAPWVMVAHSLGGPYALAFTARFRSEVSGIVMVDASHPDQFERYEQAAGRSMAPSPVQPELAAALAWTGLLRFLPLGMPDAPAAFLPLSVRGLAAETRAAPSTLLRAQAARSLGDLPLVVLSAGTKPGPDELKAVGITPEQGDRVAEAHQALMRDMASWSTRGEYRLVDGASHYIQRDRPAIVVGAVRDVMGYVRAHDTGPRRR